MTRDSKSLSEDPWAPWTAVLAFLIAIQLLLPAKGFPGPWFPHYDDSVWLGIVRHWCGGARLYTEVYDLKPPGFFLYLRPLCWVPPSPDLTIRWEPILFWMPLLIGYGLGLVILVRSMRLSQVPSLALGFFTGALVFTNRSESFFATEHPASCLVFVAIALLVQGRRAPLERRRWHSSLIAVLCTAAALINVKYAVFAALYFAQGEFSWRGLLRDLALSLVLVGAAVYLTVGWEPEVFRWLSVVSRNYWHRSLADRLNDLFNRGFFHPGTGFLAPLYLIGSWLRNGQPMETLPLWLKMASVLSIGTFVCVRCRYLIVPLFGSLAAIVMVGTVWEHTLILIFPILIAAAAELLRRPGTWLSPGAVGPILVLSVSSVVFDLTDYGQRFFSRPTYFRLASNPVRMDEGRKLAKKFQQLVGDEPWISLLASEVPLWLAPGSRRPLNIQFYHYCWGLPAWMEADVKGKAFAGKAFYMVRYRDLAAPGCATAQVAAALEPICRQLDVIPSYFYSPVEFFYCTPPGTAPPGPDGPMRLGALSQRVNRQLVARTRSADL